MHLSPRLLAQCITAAAVVGHNPTKVRIVVVVIMVVELLELFLLILSFCVAYTPLQMYCRVRGCILYERLCRRLSRRVHEVGPHDLAQAVYSLMMVMIIIIIIIIFTIIQSNDYY